jgi:steroid delta-isomerase-like uncharacterized protein
MSFADDLNAAWNAHDAERVASFYAEDGAREELIVTQARAVGRQAVAEQVQLYLDAMPDLALAVRKVSEGVGTTTFEWFVTATHRGDAPGWPARGEPVAFPGVSVIDLDANGLITEERVYTDFTGPLAGAGLIPGVEAPTWGAAG